MEGGLRVDEGADFVEAGRVEDGGIEEVLWRMGVRACVCAGQGGVNLL